MFVNTRPKVEARLELVHNRIAFLSKTISELAAERDSYNTELELLEQLSKVYKAAPEDPIDTERKNLTPARFAEPVKRTYKPYAEGKKMRENITNLLKGEHGLITKQIAELLDLDSTVVAKQIYYMKKRGTIASFNSSEGLRHYLVEEAEV